MRFELYVALRYLLARRKQAFVSLISFISMMGVAVGVMALIIALAMMTGVQGEMRDRILGSTAHVTVWKVSSSGIADYRTEVDRLLALPRVVGAAPAIHGKAALIAGDDSALISFKGIDPALEGTVTDIEGAIIEGRLEALTEEPADGRPGVFIGRHLAEQLKVRIGDTVVFLAPQAGTLLPGGMRPRTRQARVAGIYALGLYEYDANFAFVSLDFARQLTGVQGVDFIQLRLDDFFAAPQVAENVTTTLGIDYVGQDWQYQNQTLFSALWLEKVGLSIAVGLIVTVAALNIVASLVLLVMEKSRDIAILKTLGTSSKRVMAIFMAQGLIIGLVGTAVGAIGGLALAWVLDTYRLISLPADVYQVSHLPFIVEPLDFVVVVASAVVICFLATIYPSRHASRLDPVQALRYD